MLRRRFGFCHGGGFALEVQIFGEIPIGEPRGARADRAIGHTEFIDRDIQLLCGGGEQHATHLGAGKPQCRAAAFYRQAAGGHTFVGRARGISGHHVDALVSDIQFVGGDLRQRGQNALTDFTLAGVDGDAAVSVDAYPAVEHAVVVQAAGQGRSGLLCNRRRTGKTERSHDDTALLEKFATRECGGGHDYAPFATLAALAARCTARTMRLCDPQRHRLPASAVLICASVGFGLASSKALADMIMPLVQ